MTDIVFNGGSIDGIASAPSSKSRTHRAIMMAALSGGPCTIINPLISLDTISTINAMRSMGAKMDVLDGRLEIRPSRIHAPDGVVDAGNSGTTLRLLAGLSALFDSETVLTGDESIRRRPMKPLIDALEGCGAVCSSNGGCAPLSVRGPVASPHIAIDGSASSQFVSSVLMMSPLIGMPMEIDVAGNPISKPYIDVTLDMMCAYGIAVSRRDGGFHVEPQEYKPVDYRVPADLTSAACLLVAGALGGRAGVDNLDFEGLKGDGTILGMLEDAGCDVKVSERTAVCIGNGRPGSMDVDVSDTPDLFPVLCVLLSVADGESRLYGAPHLRFKESDRIASTERMLRTLGADIEGTDDGCIIRGVERLRGGRIEHGGDHRIMMAAAVASLVADGPVSMENDGCWNVSFPGFPDAMRSLGMRC